MCGSFCDDHDDVYSVCLPCSIAALEAELASQTHAADVMESEWKQSQATVERVRRDCERHEETKQWGIMPGHVNDALFVTYVKAAVVPGYLDAEKDAMLEDRVNESEPTGGE